ncbi:MAG: hypothetical protein V4574_13665 [Pseudomonadota bacterium]
MDNLPANTGASVPATRPSALATIKGGTLKMLGKARTEAGEAIHAAGVSVEKLHRRVILVIAGLLVMLFLGALFRSFGMLWVNYLLIALFGLGALYAFLQPIHIAGMLLVGGGVALARDPGTAGSALLGYAHILGRVFLALLIPLLLFALAPGDRSLGSSLPLLVLAPVVVLALWLFGRVAPRLEKFVFIALPLGALLIALSNMLIPERTLAGLGVPAWLRTGRPQDEELAVIERLREQRRNEAQAVALRAIRGKLERGEPLTPEDEAAIAQAQKDRVTLTSWFGDRYKDLETRLAAPAKAKAAPAPALPPPGSVPAPSKGWSAAVAIPSGYQLCPAGAHRAQCHAKGASDGLWSEGAKCGTVPIDRMRFRGTRKARTVTYRYVKAGSACN